MLDDWEPSSMIDILNHRRRLLQCDHKTAQSLSISYQKHITKTLRDDLLSRILPRYLLVHLHKYIMLSSLQHNDEEMDQARSHLQTDPAKLALHVTHAPRATAR
jgi:hypothetical protein